MKSDSIIFVYYIYLPNYICACFTAQDTCSNNPSEVSITEKRFEALITGRTNIHNMRDNFTVKVATESI